MSATATARRPHTRHRWSPTDDDAIRDAWATRSNVAALAQQLGTTSYACFMRASRLGIARQHPRRLWTAERTATLMQLYGLVPTVRLAALLNTTSVAIIKRAKRLGITHTANRQRQVEALLASVTHPAPATDTAALNRLRILLAYRTSMISAADACTALECSAGQLLRACQTEAVAGCRVATERGHA